MVGTVLLFVVLFLFFIFFPIAVVYFIAWGLATIFTSISDEDYFVNKITIYWQLALSSILVVAGIISIIIICINRFDFYSIWSTVLIIALNTSLIVAFLGFSVDDVGNDVSYFIYYQTAFYGTQQLSFGIQLLRALFTVPLYFKRREYLEVNNVIEAEATEKKAAEARSTYNKNQIYLATLTLLLALLAFVCSEDSG